MLILEHGNGFVLERERREDVQDKVGKSFARFSDPIGKDISSEQTAHGVIIFSPGFKPNILSCVTCCLTAVAIPAF